MIRSIAQPDRTIPKPWRGTLPTTTCSSPWAPARRRGAVQARLELEGLIRADYARPTGAATDAVVHRFRTIRRAHEARPVVDVDRRADDAGAGVQLSPVSRCSGLPGRIAPSRFTRHWRLTCGAHQGIALRERPDRLAWRMRRSRGGVGADPRVGRHGADGRAWTRGRKRRATERSVGRAVPAAVTGVFTGLWPALFVSRVDRAYPHVRCAHGHVPL